MVWQLVPPFHVGLAAKTKWGIGPLRILVSIIAALIGLTGAGEALAQSAYAPSGFEIRGGVLAHDVPGLWSGFRLESGVDINAELLGPGVAFLGGTLRPAIGGSVNTSRLHQQGLSRRPLGNRSALRRLLRPGTGRGHPRRQPRPHRAGPQGAGLPRSVPHPLRTRLSLRRAPEHLGVFRAHVERQSRRSQRGARQHRHPLRLPLLASIRDGSIRHARCIVIPAPLASEARERD